MSWPVDPPKLIARRPSKLAASIGMANTTAPDNAVRMYAGALSGENRAHEIKGKYDENNPPPPPPPATKYQNASDLGPSADRKVIRK